MKTQNLLKEYIWLVNTIRKARKISLAEINAKWCETEMSGGVEMARATFNRHKDAIQDIFGIFIDCDRRDGNRYSIGNREVLREDSVQNWMLSTLSVHTMLSESMVLKDRILLESNNSDDEHLQTILEAMRRNVRIDFSYQRYGEDDIRHFVVEPYCVKLFGRRWYMVCHFFREANEEKPASDYFATFSLDRVHSVKLTDTKFKMRDDFDAQTYFSEYFGVLTDDKVESERIVIRAFGLERYYLRDLPLHHSQKKISSTDDTADYAYYLRPTIDFCTRLVGAGNRLRVLSPQWLAYKVCSLHQDAVKMYENE